MTNYSQHFDTRETSQLQPIPGSTQVENSAGGFSWEVDDWVMLDRFLILGTEGGSYYATERKLTVENAEAVLRCVKADGLRTVNRIVEISDSGRAPKNDPALFALAIAAGLGNDATRKAALDALPKVARIGTHLFTFLENVQAFRGWGRGLRRAVGNWYNEKDVAAAALQIVKYRQRNKWTHRDALRLASPVPVSSAHNALFRWTVDRSHLGDRPVTRQETPKGRKVTKEYPGVNVARLPKLIASFESLERASNVDEVVRLVAADKDVTWEMIPTDFLREAKVWEALLPNLKLEALTRNLARMTANGLLAPLSDAARLVAKRLSDGDAIRRARLHPIKILGALGTYRMGKSERGSLTWAPVQTIVDALDDAFYLAFDNVDPTGKRFLLGLDVSGSMRTGTIGGMAGVSPCMAAAAMAMVTARSESDYYLMGFASEFRDLEISARDTLDYAMSKAHDSNFGTTDCSLPMRWALRNRVPVDTFCVYTDNETYAGDIHPSQALQQYRREMGIPAKLVVIGMEANPFTIADPNDAGMLDLVGFDTNAPGLISDFAR